MQSIIFLLLLEITWRKKVLTTVKKPEKRKELLETAKSRKRESDNILTFIRNCPWTYASLDFYTPSLIMYTSILTQKIFYALFPFEKKVTNNVISLPILFCFHFVLVGSESSPISWLPSFLLYCMHHGVGHDIGWRQRRLTSVDKSQAVIVVAPLRIPFCLLSFLPSNCFSEFLLYPILSQFLYSSCMVSIHENTLFWKTQHLSSRAITNICQWLCSSLPSLLRSPFTTTATICKKRKQKYGINMMQGNAQWCINAVLGWKVFPNTCLFGTKIQISSVTMFENL